jgi:hypothetical protein
VDGSKEENVMAPHKDNRYSVNSRLNDHDAQLLELRKEIKSVVLSPGPQGIPGATGASGANGRNGLDGRPGRDSTAVGPVGPPGRAGLAIKGDPGRQGEQGPRGEKGDSIVGPAGPRGEKGERGDITVYGDAELQAAVVQLRTELIQQRARFLAAHFQALAEAKGPHEKIWRQRLETLKRDAGL